MKVFFPKANTKGYSFVELIVYMAIFALISLVIIKSLVTSLTIYAQSQTYRKLQGQGELVMKRITRELRQASTVNTASSTFNSATGVLSITGKDTSGVSQTVIFSATSTAVQVSVNGVSSPLTAGQVAPNSLIFRQVTTSTGTAIKVELQLKTTSGYALTAPFYTTVLLRGK